MIADEGIGNGGDGALEWLYYAPLNRSKICRVKLDALLDQTLSDTQLDKRIETCSKKPNDGGLCIDRTCSLYLTALETNSVAIVLARDRSVHTLVSDNKLLWPDGVSYHAADGFIYLSAAQVHLGEPFNNGKNKSKASFCIFRFKPLVAVESLS